MEYNETSGIDLHIHSNASDGTESPEDILRLAEDLGLRAIAITDHDTIDGSKAALRNGIPKSIEFVTGVEISASPPSQYPCSGSFHILGYFIDLDDPELNRTLDILQKARENRNPQIVERLNSLGVDITIEEVMETAGDSQVGRPHIAGTLIQKGAVSTINEAFQKYLGKGKPAYIDKFRMNYDEAVDAIRKAGGIPVLAHPALLNPQFDEPLENLIRLMKDIGLEGLEVYYPEHTPSLITEYCDIARRLSLLMTGGTDFHGKLKPDIKIGSGKGNLFIPYTVFQRLKNHRQHA